MKKRRQTAVWVAAWLGAVFLLGQAALMSPSREWFPFYSWSMFARVPGVVDSYELWVVSWPDWPLERPVEIRAMKGTYGGWQSDPRSASQKRMSQSVTVAHLLQRTGRLWEKTGNATEVVGLRRQLESLVLPPGTVYELRVSSRDVLESWAERRERPEGGDPGRLLVRWEAQ